MRLPVTTLCALLVAPPFANAQSTGQRVSKAVLVTGASSGLGRKITERLAADGYFVYATARKEEDLKALGAIRNVQSLRGNIDKNMLARLPEDAKAKVSKALGPTLDVSQYPEPDEVAVAVEQALFEPSPKRRYVVAPEPDIVERTIRKQIEQLVQLNEGQRYTYGRAALIKMLDEALTNARPRTK